MQEVVSVSVWNMFMHSDAFMKTMIIIMCLASVWSWAIIIDKIRTFKKIRKKINQFERRFWSGGSLDSFYDELEKDRN